MDDITVCGYNRKAHDLRLRHNKVLETSRAVNLRLNKATCVVRVSELTCLGDVISTERVKFNQRKADAVEMMPRPQSKKDVLQFLGVVNCLGEFISNLSFKTPLWMFPKNNYEWFWDKQQEEV